MPKIPFNPSIRPVGASQVRRVTDRTQQANAVQQEATQGLVSAARDATLAAGGLYVNEMEKQFNTDMLAGGAMLDELKFKRDEELASIPVSSSVDYDKVSSEINTKYDNEWSQWSSKNVRNLNHEIVSDMRQRSINAFGLDGQTTNAKNKVVYENKRNLDQLAKADGIYATQLKRNPNDPDALAGLYRNQDARVIAGFQTESEAAANKEAIQTKAFETSDDQIQLSMDNAVRVGDYELADTLLEGLSELNTKEEKKKIRDETFSNGTYNRFELLSKEVDSLSGWDQYSESVKDDTHLDDQVKKRSLQQNAIRGREKIHTAQRSNTASYLSAAKTGVFSITEFRARAELDTGAGIYGDASELENQMLDLASLYQTQGQVKEDKVLFDAATTGEDSIAGEFYDEVFGAALSGTMDEDKLAETLTGIESAAWSEPVKRQMKRTAFNAFDATLESGLTIEEGQDAGFRGFWKYGLERQGSVDPITLGGNGEVALNETMSALKRQRSMLNGNIEPSSVVNQAIQQTVEWAKINPNPSASDTEKFIKSITQPIDADTRREQRLRFK